MNEAQMRAYQPQPVDPSSVKHIHFIGVAGTGMGTLAGMLKQAGFHVTGSDQGIYPPMSHQLEAWKIPVQTGFHPEHLDPRPDLVVVGNACRPSNPEAQAAIAQGIPCTSMPRAIHDFFLKDRHAIVIAGTHGKTTTTALTGWLLHDAGLEPGVLVGGVSLNFDGSFSLPKGDTFIIEGDEYDSALFDKVPKFVHYNPKHVILTSVEFDHADIYDDIDAVKQAFLRLMKQLDPTDQLLVCQDYPIGLDVASTSRANQTVYGTDPKADLYAQNIQNTEEGVHFDLYLKGDLIGNFLSPMFGRYNITNAIAAIGVALQLDLPVERIQSALRSFAGIKRRQEIFSRVGEIVIIDDFAHHPTAIRVTSEAVRERYPERRIWGIFEPRSNTARRNHFQDLLPLSFQGCDNVLLGWPYRYDKMDPNERLDMEKLIADLQEHHKTAIAFPKVQQIVDYITAKARPNDIFLIMSNGSFDGLHQLLTDALSTRFQAD